MSSLELMGGKLQLYRRPNSRFWQCSASVGGKQRRATTKQESLEQARMVAEDWFLTLQGKSRAGLLISEKTFRQAADQFVKEYGGRRHLSDCEELQNVRGDDREILRFSYQDHT